MQNKRILIVLFAAVLTASASSVGLNSASNATHEILPSHGHDSERSNTIPDHVAYWLLFHKMEHLREKTKQLQAEGRIGQKPYFILKREAGLSEEQSIALEAIALACSQRVKQQDKKAKAIIAAFRSQFPDGRVPADGPPPPPPELKLMWDERNAMILGARDQLRATFGEGEFARFDNYVKFYHGANTSPVTINPVSRNPRQE